MTVEERLAVLEKEVYQLKAIEEIRNLKGKYFRCLDSKLWDDLETTLHPDISTSYSDGKLVFNGPKEVTNYFKEVMPITEISMHMGHSPEFEFESDTVCWGRWYLQDYLIFVDTGYAVQGAAFYRDKYVKHEGKWLILETGYQRMYEEVYKRQDGIKMRTNMHMPIEKKK